MRYGGLVAARTTRIEEGAAQERKTLCSHRCKREGDVLVIDAFFWLGGHNFVS